MKILNNNRYACIDVRSTGMEGEICELAIIPLTSFKPADPTLHLRIIPETWENYDGPSKCGPEYREKTKKYGQNPSFAAHLLDAWYKKLEIPWNKRLIPIAYNWPLASRMLINWIGQPMFYDMFDSVEYRDLIPIFRYWTEFEYRMGHPIPFPKCRMADFCYRLGMPQAKNMPQLSSLQRADVVYKLYKRILDLELPFGYQLPLFEITPIDYGKEELSDEEIVATVSKSEGDSGV